MAQILQDISWVGHQSGNAPFAANVQPINGKAINWSASKCFSGPCVRGKQKRTSGHLCKNKAQNSC